jgi:hypothetical protein
MEDAVLPKICISSRAPAPARLAERASHGTHYIDSFSLRLPEGAPVADDLLIRTLTDLPGWVTSMLALRNAVVSPLGLRTGSERGLSTSELPLCPGGHVAFFAVKARETATGHDEILLGEDDAHLDIRLSGLCARDADGEMRFAVTTLVQFHNAFGRLYFVPVRPFHRLMMRALLVRVDRWLEVTVTRPADA